MILVTRPMMSQSEQEKNVEAAVDVGMGKASIKVASSDSTSATNADKAILSDVKKKKDAAAAAATTDSLAGATTSAAPAETREGPAVPKQQDKKKDKIVDGTSSVNSTNSDSVQEEVPLKDRISVPNENDVLFGRGKPYQNHPGNMRLHKLVDFHRKKYLQSKRFDKCVIAKQIVRVIKETSGRFLKRAGDGLDYWVVVSDEVAREKVSHALRSKVRMGKTSSSSSSALAMGGGGTAAGDAGLLLRGADMQGMTAPSGAAMAAALGGGLHPSLFGGGGLAGSLRNSILPPFRGAAFGGGGLQSSLEQGSTFPQRLESNTLTPRMGGNLVASLGNNSNNVMAGADVFPSLGLGGLSVPAAAFSQSDRLHAAAASGLFSQLPSSVHFFGADIFQSNMIQSSQPGQLDHYSTAANIELAIELLRRRRTQQQQQGNFE